MDPNDLNITLIPTSESDNCGLDQNAVYTDSLSLGGCDSTGIILRTWSLTDMCNNTTTGIQTITIVDTIPPTFTPPSDITIACDLDQTDLDITGDVTDESDSCAPLGSINATYVDYTVNAFPCSGAGYVRRTWTLEDQCGNSVSYDQLITIIDTIAPTFTGAT